MNRLKLSKPSPAVIAATVTREDIGHAETIRIVIAGGLGEVQPGSIGWVRYAGVHHLRCLVEEPDTYGRLGFACQAARLATDPSEFREQLENVGSDKNACVCAPCLTRWLLADKGEQP